MPEFMNGAIRKVVLHNFGKSSIVCALCLGLGGSTSSLGRADKIGDFIKRGCQSGYTEIYLQNDTEQSKITVVRRIFFPNKSKYMINNRTSTEKHVQELTASLNVQVDNLCQFLAQERVSEFAKLEPRGLLKDTERAADKGQLYEQHMKLIELRKQETDARKKIEASRNELFRKEAQLNSLAIEVDRIRQRSNLQYRIKLLGKKKPWIEFNHMKDFAKLKHQEKQAADAALEKIRKQQEPLRNVIALVRESNRSCKDEFTRLRNLCKQHDQKFNILKSQCENHEVDVQTFGDELVGVEKRAEQLQQEIASKESQIEDLQHKLNSLPDPESIMQELREIHAKKEELRNSQNTLMSDIRDLDDRIGVAEREKNRFGSQLKNFESERARRCAKLFQIYGRNGLDTDCKRFMDWLDKQGRARCKGTVYGPLGLDVHCAAPGAERFIEHAIPWSAMLGFVVENDEDWNLLSRAKQDLQVRVNICSDSHYDFSHTSTPPEGVQWLDDAVEAPRPVLQYLRAAHSFSEIVWMPTSSASPHLVLKSGPSDNRPGKLYFGNQLAHVTISRYGSREKSFGVERISDARFLTQSADVSIVAELTQKIAALDSEFNQLSAEKNEMQARLVPVGRAQKELNTASGELNNKEKQRKIWNSTIQSLIRSKNNIVHQAKDPEEEKRIICEKMSETNQKRIKAVQEIVFVIRDFNKALEKRSSASLAMVHTSELVSVVQNSISQQSAFLRHAEERATQAKDDLKVAAKRASVQKAIAEKRAPIEKYKEKFDELPDELEDIEREEHKLQVQIDAVVGDDSVVARHKSLQSDIVSLKMKHEYYDSKHAEQLAEINFIKEEWVRNLDHMAQTVSATYKQYFRKFFCDGDVHLVKSADEADWGMSVRVRFRSGDLQQLSQCRQSGGERSVATMLYLLALQSVTQCPFRVVDEINQGMDAINERNVFNQLVACSTGSNTPQIFCITPKLLPNLDFTPAITILIVCNGPWNLPQDVMDMQKCLENVKRRRVR